MERKLQIDFIRKLAFNLKPIYFLDNNLLKSYNYRKIKGNLI